MAVIKTAAELQELLAEVAQQPRVVIDTETTGLEPWKQDRLCGIGLAWHEGEDLKSYYIPYRHRNGAKDSEHELVAENLELATLPAIWEAFDKVPKLIGWNLKFDLAMMWQDGFRPREDHQLIDVIPAARMCNKDKYSDLSLKGQTAMLLGADKAAYDAEFKAYLRKNKWSKHFDYAPIDKIAPYCEDDCGYAEDLLDIYEQRIEDTNQVYIWEQEQELTRTLWEMESLGIAYDKEYAESKVGPLGERIKELEQDIYRETDTTFNIGSSKQLGDVMANLGLKSTVKSIKTGAPSWGVGAMMAIDHPVAGLILEYRGTKKLLNSYFEPILEWPGAVHPSFKNWGTVTGRLACSDPNLQNVAKNISNLSGNDTSDEVLAALSAAMGAKEGVDMTKVGGGMAGGLTYGGTKAIGSKFDNANDALVSVRRLYIPREGCRMVLIDYSQMEMRVFSDYIKDEGLSALLEDPKFDFHSHVAKTVWSVDESSDLWAFYRTLAKAINFGLIYGIGMKKLASQIQKTLEEAKTYKAEYFSRFPKAYTFIDLVCKTVEARGWIKNRFGRRYWIDPDRAYIGVNYLVQGSSADIVKNRMVAARDWLLENGLKTRMLVQVHDEIIFEVPYEEEELVIPELKRIMEERQIGTFLPVEVSIGEPSWAEPRKIEVIAA